MSTTDSREAFLEWKRDEGDIPNYIPDATIMASGYSDFELKAWQAALAWQAAKATGTAGEIDADAEMAKVKRDVELMGVGFLVDGKRCSLDRITWFNRLGDTWLPPPPGYPTEAARQPAPALPVSERDMMIAQAVRQACVNSYGPDDSASDYAEKMGDIDLATVIRAATNRSQP